MCNKLCTGKTILIIICIISIRYFSGNISSKDNQDNVDDHPCQLDRNVLDTMMCAGETNRDSCQGDSGGKPPLSSNLSHFETCAREFWGTNHHPHFFTDYKCATPGPLNCMNPSTNTWELCGVVSWGARCAEPG